MSDNRKDLHVWVGTNNSNEEVYTRYFELDHSVEGDFDDPNYKLCEFCKDIGLIWYDEDFIGIIPRSNQEVPLEEIMIEAGIDDDELPLAIAHAKELGIEKANAIFWYQDAELELKQPIKDTYNGLKYLGVYQGA